jgi:four helix bundle protein
LLQIYKKRISGEAGRRGGREAGKLGSGEIWKYFYYDRVFFQFFRINIKIDMDFRFQKLEIWKESVTISKSCFYIIEKLKKEKYYSFADQLARATLSISSNIAEGSGSATKRDFANFLNISRRSLFECANIIIILKEFGFLEQQKVDEMLESFKNLSAKIYYFRISLLDN